MEDLLTFEALASLVSLTLLEVVLGIDNIVFLSILTSRLEPGQRAKARQLGLVLAMGMRIVLLFGLSYIMGLSRPLLQVVGIAFSGRDLILLGGGLFLIAKATHEIHTKLEGDVTSATAPALPASLPAVLLQVTLLDIVFSLDSVITAVGMSRQLPVMVTAVLLSVGMMLFYARAVGDFIEQHPTMKMLALSFLLLIGVLLMADGMGQHLNKGYVYFAMAFSLGVEILNMRTRKGPPALQVHG
jgi:predicted tellurium resistance membrane protein TerC